MSEQQIYICDCGKEFSCGKAAHPPGWEWHGSRLICDDCVKIAAFSHPSDESEARSAATPIRFAADLHDRDTAILLRSGVYLDLADPDCTRISPVDIAAGLRQFRFAAQTEQPYTIAQHSLLVLDLVEREAGPAMGEMDTEHLRHLRRCALLHDAAEAFIHDITLPLKCQLPGYKCIEAEFERRFADAFDLRWTRARHEIVKRADLKALAIEAGDLLGCVDRWPVLEGIDRFALRDIHIDRVWSPAEAEARFLDAFEQLQPAERIAA